MVIWKGIVSANNFREGSTLTNRAPEEIGGFFLKVTS